MPTGQSRDPAASATPSSRTLLVEPQPRQAAAAAAVSGPWTTLTREANGHFYASALVNGQRVEFIVDTGATTVALDRGRRAADRHPGRPRQFEVIGTGASGRCGASR